MSAEDERVVLANVIRRLTPTKDKKTTEGDSSPREAL